MFCSTVIPTIGRPTLSRAIQSVLDQAFDREDFEVIVVNDSGNPLPAANWQESSRVRIIHTQRRNRSVARNAGAAIAKGRYLHFLDDDDWMLPGALECSWQLSQETSAAWLYGAFRLVDNQGVSIAEISPDETGNCLIQLIAWEWLPLQASWIDAEAFFTIGGFASLDALLGGFEDIHLSREIACHYDMARSGQVVACIRVGAEGSTTNYADMFAQNRLSREKVISERRAFSRMRNSARVNLSRSGYWYGKVLYYYLISVIWNLRHRRLFTACSRGLFAVAGFLGSGRRIFSADYWHGAFNPHYPRTWGIFSGVPADELAANARAKFN